jgi:hypothetical protein
LDTLNNSGGKTLDNTSPRQELAGQMNRQQGALTNLLSGMRAVTEQAESTEPLLSKELYDILRRADQMHTDNQLDVGAQLVQRGFLPQASEAESAARTNIDELRQSVDRAAESILGSEGDALRYAQKELDDLSHQVERELTAGTNASPSAAGTNASQHVASGAASRNQTGEETTNSVASAGGESGARQAQQHGDQPAQAGQENGGQAASQNQPGNAPGSGDGGKNQPGSNQQQPASQQARDSAPGQNPASAGAQNGTDAAGGNGGQNQLREFVQQLGGGAGGLGNNGPITGNNYMDWSDRLRDVEQVLDSQDLRNQLATVRERVGVLRGYYRRNGYIPTPAEVQTKVLEPLALARAWVNQELARTEDSHSLAPLDRDPVPDKYSDLVQKYYEKLGSAQ